MARIAGIDIPRNKKVPYSLSYIYGIGPTTGFKICEEAKVDPEAPGSPVPLAHDVLIDGGVVGAPVEEVRGATRAETVPCQSGHQARRQACSLREADEPFEDWGIHHVRRIRSEGAVRRSLLKIGEQRRLLRYRPEAL